MGRPRLAWYVRAALQICVCNAEVKTLNPPAIDTRLQELSGLVFPDNKSPPHLHFHAQVNTILQPTAQQEFMAALDWPFSLDIGGKKYTLMARGYFSGAHYWCKVLHAYGQLLGVWIHNDLENESHARLVSEKPSDMGGAQPHTSWVMYSRVWTSEEKTFVDGKIEQLKKDNPQAKAHHIPFVRLHEILSLGGSAQGQQQGPTLDSHHVLAVPLAPLALTSTVSLDLLDLVPLASVPLAWAPASSALVSIVAPAPPLTHLQSKKPAAATKPKGKKLTLTFSQLKSTGAEVDSGKQVDHTRFWEVRARPPERGSSANEFLSSAFH
ncbi:hypothetical protein PSHT_16530 [Puccinia striiformis]|uniref:Uncharacterized protein n=1 Tax=Puccinia striiformis TaxID=27350 RepID=A0A2S4U9J8_9BASI|nr:hypothetical protein PSHT_16530 [Puccinia striiformis]